MIFADLINTDDIYVLHQRTLDSGEPVYQLRARLTGGEGRLEGPYYVAVSLTEKQGEAIYRDLKKALEL